MLDQTRYALIAEGQLLTVRLRFEARGKREASWTAILMVSWLAILMVSWTATWRAIWMVVW